MVITELCDYFVFEILQSSFVLFLFDFWLIMCNYVYGVLL